MRINNIVYILQEMLRKLDKLCHIPRVGKEIDTNTAEVRSSSTGP